MLMPYAMIIGPDHFTVVVNREDSFDNYFQTFLRTYGKEFVQHIDELVSILNMQNNMVKPGF